MYLTYVDSFFNDSQTQNSIEYCLFENNQFAIFMDNSANLNIIGSNFSNNFASFGSSIYLMNSTSNSFILITDCVFIESNSQNSGGAIYISNFGDVLIMKSQFLNNFADVGGAIVVFSSQSNSIFEITDCFFINNNSTNAGGAVYLEKYGNIKIIRSKFSNNFATSGTALLLMNSQPGSLFELVDCFFSENNSTTYGGTIEIENCGNISMKRSTFLNNIAFNGGAILLFASLENSFMEIIECSFAENNHTNDGGAIFSEKHGNISIIRSIFLKNLASYGGAIFFVNGQQNSMVEIDECVFNENNASNYAGTIYMESFGNISISKSNFSNNFAISGGAAVYLVNSQLNSIIKIANCVFIENNSPTVGGAIYQQNIGNSLIFRSNFSYNSARLGGAIYLYSSQSDSLLEITNCDLIENNSTNGGAIYIQYYGNTSLTRNNFLKNFANIGAAIYCSTQRTIYL